MKSDSLLTCPYCMGWLVEPSLTETGHWDGVCTRCHRKAIVSVYPSIISETSAGKPGQAVVDDAQSSCMKHPSKQAVEACSECGRFMCETCRIDLGGKALCPECTERALKGQLRSTSFVQMLKRSELATPGQLLFPIYVGLLLAWLAWLGDATIEDAALLGVFVAVFFAFIFYPYALYLRLRKGRTLLGQLPTAGLRPLPTVAHPALGVVRPIEFALGLSKVPVLETQQVFLGDTFLLNVRKSGLVERYQRISYKDIRAIRVQHRADYLFVFGIIYLVVGLLFLETFYSAILSPGEDLFSTTFTVFYWGWLAWVLVSNARHGRACHVEVYTPVSKIRLDGLGRWRGAEAFLAEVSTRIAQQQGAWQPEPAVDIRRLDFRPKKSSARPTGR